MRKYSITESRLRNMINEAVNQAMNNNGPQRMNQGGQVQQPTNQVANNGRQTQQQQNGWAGYTEQKTLGKGEAVRCINNLNFAIRQLEGMQIQNKNITTVLAAIREVSGTLGIIYGKNNY